MNYIENNPSRVLGVLSNSSMKEIVSNSGKIKAFAKTGKAISFDNDFVKLLGSLNRDSHSISDAYNAISLPKDRLVAGLFWFIQDSPIDEVALNKLRSGEIQGAITLLRKKVTVSACVNLAVIHLIEKKWTTALYYYTYLLNSEERRQQLLSIISDNESLLSEKEIVESFVEKLITSFPEVGWVESIHQHEVTIEDKTYSIENFFGDSNVYECIIKKSNDKLFKLLRNSINKANSTLKSDANANLKAAKLLEKDAKFVLRSLRLSLGKDNKEYISLCDQVANVILDRCIDYYNHDQNNPRRPKNIIQLLRFAMRTAESKIPKDRCRKNYDQIKSECDKLLPDEIENELSYIKKQIREFNNLNSFSNYSGYLNATIGICYQKMESIKTKVGSENIHYVNICSEVVDFAINVICKEIDGKYKTFTSSYNNKEALSNLKNAIEWGKAILENLKTFPKNADSSNNFIAYCRTFNSFYNEYCGPNARKVIEEYKLVTTAPSTVKVGDTFRILYTINYRGEERFIAPAFRELEVVKGPARTFSIKSKFVSGKSVSEPTTTYYYDLRAKRTGNFNITPASIVIDGAAYTSTQLTIKAVEPETPSVTSRVSSNYTKDTNKRSQSRPITNNSGKNDRHNYLTILLAVAGFLVLGIVLYALSNSDKTAQTTQSYSSPTVQESAINEEYDSIIVEDNDYSSGEEVSAPAYEQEKEPVYEEVYYKTGDRPYQAFYGRGRYDSNTQNSLRIKNGSSCDAVVFLESLNGKKARHVYIRKDETFTMTQIPGGKYIIKIMHGNSWNPDKYNGDDAPKGGFMKDVSMSKSESYDPFDYPYPESGGYYEYEVMLYKVANGNMQTETITSSEMF